MNFDTEKAYKGNTTTKVKKPMGTPGEMPEGVVVWPSKKARTVIEGYLLEGYDEKTAFDDDNIMVVHKVPGIDRKVLSRRLPYAMTDKDTGKPFHIYNKFAKCVLSDQYEAYQKGGRNGVPPNMKGIEINALFYVTKYQVTLEKEDGTTEVKVSTPNKVALVGFNVADRFFASSSAGLAKTLAKLYGKKKLGKYKLQILPGDIDLTDDDTKLSDEPKLIKDEVKQLREDIEAVREEFKDLYPMSNKEWYDTYFTGEGDRTVAQVSGEAVEPEVDGVPEDAPF